MLTILICKSGTCSYVTRSVRESEQEKFCMLCGQPLISKCPKCNSEIKSMEQKFCYECSERLKDEPPMSEVICDKSLEDLFTVHD